MSSDNNPSNTLPAVLDVIEEEAGESGTPFAACLKEARALKPGDDQGVIGLLVSIAVLAAAKQLSDLQIEILIQAIHKATKLGLKQLRKTWKIKLAEAEKQAWEAGAAERARAEAEQEARWQHEREMEREQLWASCRGVAESKTLLKDMETAADKLGVVNERAGIRAGYLACVSRLLLDDAVRLLRLGAPASGKNLVAEKGAAIHPRGRGRPGQRVEPEGSRLLWR